MLNPDEEFEIARRCLFEPLHEKQVFVAGDTSRLKDLQTAVRQFMAWKSILNEREPLDLDPFQAKQADTKRKNADDTVTVRIPETYQWLLVPNQPDPRGSIEWKNSDGWPRRDRRQGAMVWAHGKNKTSLATIKSSFPQVSGGNPEMSTDLHSR